jgi:hypothetical protein
VELPLVGPPAPQPPTLLQLLPMLQLQWQPRRRRQRL